MSDDSDLDFFRGNELVDDPYPYFDWLRERGPIHRDPRYVRGLTRLHLELD